MGNPASCSTTALSSFVRARISDWSCAELSPPLMDSLMCVRVRVLSERVLELACELLTLQLRTGTNVIGCTQ